MAHAVLEAAAVAQQNGHNGYGNAFAELPPAPLGESQCMLYDFTTLTMQQLLAFASEHNTAHGVPADPMGAALEGTERRACIRGVQSHAFTFGGNPRPDAHSAAWKRIAKYLPNRLQRSGAAGSGSSSMLADAGSNAAAAVRMSMGDADGPRPPPSRQQMYGTEAEWLQRSRQPFMMCLERWLGRAIDLPLLAPGALPLSLPILFREVHALGGYDKVKQRQWQEVAERLLDDSGLGMQLKQAYISFLLPLERCMPPGNQPIRALEWLQQQLSHRAHVQQAVPTLEQVESCITAARPTAQWYHQQQGQDTGKRQLAEDARTWLCAAARYPQALVPVLLQAGASGIAAPGAGGKGKGAAAAGTPAPAVKQEGPVAAADEQGGQQQQGKAKRRRTSAMATPAAAADGRQEVDGPDADAEGDPRDGPSAVGGEPQAPQLLLFLESQRQLLAGPPACTVPAPDLHANFLQLWEQCYQPQQHSGKGHKVPRKPRQSKGSIGTDGQGSEEGGEEDEEGSDDSSVDGSSDDEQWSGEQLRKKPRTGGSRRDKVGGANKQRQRQFMGRTPRCGACKTCLNPQMKKACLTNRERISQGLPPVVPE